MSVWGEMALAKSTIASVRLILSHYIVTSTLCEDSTTLIDYATTLLTTCTISIIQNVEATHHYAKGIFGQYSLLFNQSCRLRQHYQLCYGATGIWSHHRGPDRKGSV